MHPPSLAPAPGTAPNGWADRPDAAASAGVPQQPIAGDVADRPESAAEQVLVGLDPEQRAAVLAPRGPVCILAGAGTGKTRAITARIAHGVLSGEVPAGQVLAVTFTARAAGELRARLRALGATGVQARTFHAAALRQLSYFWPQVTGQPAPKLVENKISLVGQAGVRMRAQLSRTELRDCTSEIEWAKASLVVPSGYATAAAAAGREPPRDHAFVASLYDAYEQAKSAVGVVDFDDLLLLTAGTLEEHPGVAAEMRARYRSFVVDEYQDVTPLQQRLLDAWLGGRDDLCVVGDANQTIYSFTGATPAHLLGFSRRFPDATVVRLVRDYRSTPQVVALANGVLAPARDVPAGARLQLVAQRPPGPEPVPVERDSEPEEAAEVVRRISALLARGVPASEVAVLYRVNAQSEVYEQALGAAGIPYLVRGGERFFDRPEVREAVRLLRGAAHAADAGRPDGLTAQVTEVLSAAGWQPEAPPGGAASSARERWENLAALARLAQDAAATQPQTTLAEFADDLLERAANQHVPTVQGVTLASLHAAKGLEWDAVFLVGLVDGTLPIVHAATPAQVEEERRLLYVGVTRAREHLVLSWALSRAEGGRKSRKPSRFLVGLPGILRADAGGSPAAPDRHKLKASARCRVCGRGLTGALAAKLGRCDSCPSGVDEALFERLRAWRSARAKEQGQPAFCVFTDATLQALAERRPTSTAELVAVPGIGQSKLDRYGEDVLGLMQP